MTIKELMEQLQTALESYGDLDVEVYCSDDEGLDIVKLNVEEHWVDTRDGHEHGERVFCIEVQ